MSQESCCHVKPGYPAVFVESEVAIQVPPQGYVPPVQGCVPPVLVVALPKTQPSMLHEITRKEAAPGVTRAHPYFRSLTARPPPCRSLAVLRQGAET